MKYIFLLAFYLFGQTQIHAAVITGKVIDGDDSRAIEAVSVYINGSSMGTLTKADGSFEIKGNFVFPVDVVFQNLAYQSKMIRVKAEGALDKPIQLYAKSQEMEEFVVLAPLKDGWAQYGKDFLESFLSYSDFANQCEILNKEVVQFRVDNAAGILYVSANAPIVVKNKALGYLLHFDLQDFKRDYGRQTTHFAGYTRFESMSSKNRKQIEKWEANRKLSYLGSLNHFVRAAYNNKVDEEGFQLNVIVRAPAGEYGDRVPVWTDTFSTKDTASMALLMKKMIAELDQSFIDTPLLLGWGIGIKKWIDTANVADPTVIYAPYQNPLRAQQFKFILEKSTDHFLKVKYFETNRLPDDRMAHLNRQKGLIKFDDKDTASFNKWESESMKRAYAAPYDYLYTTPYPIDSFLTIENGTKMLFSENLIQVMYKLEKEETAYLNTRDRFKGSIAKPGFQTSTLVFPQKKAVLLMSNGNFNEQYDLFLEGYWSYEKLDKMLPLDYEPK